MPSQKELPHAVLIQGVTKVFAGRAVVDDLSLSIPQGSIFGFIGPNGSGKTTTLRMILNLILPDSGRIAVLGQSSTLAARDRVSYLPEERGLYKKMTVRHVLRYYGLLKSAEPKSLDASIDQWLRRLDLTRWVDTNIEALSKGTAQKVQFIAALVSEPDLVILDEPFSGLDPASTEVMKTIIRQVKAQGRSVIFSTHQMAMAEELCDRIGMMHLGRKVLDGTLKQIKKRFSQGTIRVRTNKGLKFLRGLKGVLSVKSEGDFQVVALSSDSQIFLKLLLRQSKVLHFEKREASLQEIFLGLVQTSGSANVLL